jgi:hypothetical protein
VTTQFTNQIVSDAKNLPDLIAKAQTFDPQLAESLAGKSLAASKTVWGTALTMGVSWVATHYALGWPPESSAEVSGAIVLFATVVLRSITRGPITGIVTAAPTTQGTAP